MTTPNQQHNAAKPQINSAGQPTISVRAERSAQSLDAERQALMLRRAKLAGAITLPIVLIAGLLLFFRPFVQPSAGGAALDSAISAPAVQAPALAIQPTAAAAPAVQAPATSAPALAIQPTAAAAPAAQPLPTAAPAAVVAPQSAAAPAGGAVACDAISGLPVYASATCVKRDLDNDDGVIKAENSYATASAADEVRRFYEGAFTKDGWTLQEFDYTVDLGARRVKVQVEAKQGAGATFTKIQLTEYGAPAGARNTCTAIDGLPAFPNATCSDFDTGEDNGAIKVENSYTTSASPEEVRRFYEGTFAQNSWAGQDFKYDVVQGLRRLQVEVETKAGPSGAFTGIKIAEK